MDDYELRCKIDDLEIRNVRLRGALGWCIKEIDSVCGVSPKNREAFERVVETYHSTF